MTEPSSPAVSPPAPQEGLKPCPFCGAQATTYIGHTDEGDTFNVACSRVSCGARIEELGIDQDQAIAAWNRRPAAPLSLAPQEIWLIWSREHSAWWRPKSAGYA